MDKIVPYLWYDSEAKQAIDLYMSLFKDSEIIVAQKSEETTSNNNGDFYDFKLAGLLIGAFNGGPFFKLNSSISFMVHCDTKEEVQLLWNNLIDGGTELAPLKTHDINKSYGWVKDRYGVSWQLTSSEAVPYKKKIQPFLMFSGPVTGKAKEAMSYYTEIFKDGKILDVFEYEEGQATHPKAKISHAIVEIMGMEIIIADYPDEKDETFNEAFSFMLLCDDQAEIDSYWEKLSADPDAEQCGWLKDKFGVSWQIVPSNLSILLSTGTREQRDAVTQTYLPMKKLDIDKLEQAWKSAKKQ